MKVRENPGLVDSIYVIDPTDTARYFRAELTDYCAQYKGYTRAEVASLVGHGKGNDVEGAESNLTIRLNKLDADERKGLMTRAKPAIRSPKKGPSLRAADTIADRSVSQAMPSPPEAPGPAVVRPHSMPVDGSVSAIAAESARSETEAAKASLPESDNQRSSHEPANLPGLKAAVMNKLFDGDDDLE